MQVKKILHCKKIKLSEPLTAQGLKREKTILKLKVITLVESVQQQKTLYCQFPLKYFIKQKISKKKLNNKMLNDLFF